MRHLTPLVVAAVLVGGCTKPVPPPANVLADLDDSSRWQPISIAEFQRECPDFCKALEEGTVTLPDPYTGLVSNVGLVTFKVRIENRVIKEAWREKRAE